MKSKTIQVVLCEPGKPSRIITINNTLDSLQKAVGGCIQTIYPFDDPVALVCDEEGLFKETKWNRRVTQDCAIKGTFFLCGIGEEDFGDIPEDLIEKYSKQFFEPEEFEFTPPPIRVIRFW